MREITENLELCKFDGVSTTTVYKGHVDCLEKAELQWRKEEWHEMFGEVEVLTLSEIVEQLKEETSIITVFIDEALRGRILQYGNYGDSWWEIGTTCGYA